MRHWPQGRIAATCNLKSTSEWLWRITTFISVEPKPNDCMWSYLTRNLALSGSTGNRSKFFGVIWRGITRRRNDESNSNPGA
jgi:hypothetical protein